MKAGDIMGWKKKLGFITACAGITTATMHVINRVFSYIATADDLLQEDSFQFYDWRFGQIAYKKTGNGAPVLLIHDFSVWSSSYEWENIRTELSKTNTIYTIDLLGCGCSERPIFTYTNFLYVQLITDFIKHIIGEKTDIIVSGNSCSFVLMACANDESIINRVVMINPDNMVHLAKIPSKRTKLIKYILFTPVIGTFIYNIKVNKRTISHVFASSYFYNQNEIKEKDILECFEASQRNKARSKYLYACQKSRFTNANIMSCLKKLNNSIFIVSGNSNPENLLTASQYQNQLPSIEIVSINNTKQMPHVEKPDEFLEQIKILFSTDE